MAQHKIKQKSYRDYLNVKEAGKELILYVVGNDAVVPLKKQYIGFCDTTVLVMINHLRYFSLLNRFQVLLGNCRITTSNKEKTMAAGVQMWQSEMFTEDQMVVWENRGAMAQMWAALQTYFTEKWLEQKELSAMTAKQLQFKEAALLAQETVAAEEEGKTQALLFAILQDQHAKQIAQMEATNKTDMDAMMEQMNALVAARDARHAHQLDKVNTPPGSNIIPLGGGAQAKKPRQKKALCPNCKCFVMHKPANCFELEANKASHYPGWKSIFAAPATA